MQQLDLFREALSFPAPDSCVYTGIKIDGHLKEGPFLWVALKQESYYPGPSYLGSWTLWGLTTERSWCSFSWVLSGTSAQLLLPHG